MQVSFTKMQGLGNDFIVLDGISQTVQLSQAQFRFLADRHFGIGADGMENDFRVLFNNIENGEQ